MAETYSRLNSSLARENSVISNVEESMGKVTNPKTASSTYVSENVLSPVSKLAQSTSKMNSVRETPANKEAAKLFLDLHTSLIHITQGRKLAVDTSAKKDQAVEQDNQISPGMR